MIEKKVKTTENWCGNFSNDMFKVYLTSDNFVCCCGNDDLSYGKEFGGDRDSAEVVYNNITDYTTRYEIKNMGFVSE